MNKLKRARRKAINKAFILGYKATHPCVDCGGGDNLTFDHINGSNKIGNVSSLVAKGRSHGEVLREIGKCEVRCHRCHTLKEKERFLERIKL